ncbi:MAG: hypothetical protein L3J10_01865 [Sulfurimonas sp.]|nr:hypothetical protein [Sulfurimonas sp.]
MNKDLKKLKSIGSQKIHEITHISKAHVQAIIDEKFDNLHSVQLAGFVSILEREYDIDLSELKNNAILYFNENIQKDSEEKNVNVFIPKNNTKSLILFVGIIVIIFVIIFSSVNFLSEDANVTKVVKTDNKVIEKKQNDFKMEQEVQNTIEKKMGLENKDIIEEKIELENKDNNKENIVEEFQDKNETLSFNITPEREVWMGYIDLSTHKKYQKIFTEKVSLDPKKNWLLAFGHGNIDIEINGIIKKFENPKNIRFSYINSQLIEISLEELKVLNKGNRW